MLCAAPSCRPLQRSTCQARRQARQLVAAARVSVPPCMRAQPCSRLQRGRSWSAGTCAPRAKSGGGDQPLTGPLAGEEAARGLATLASLLASFFSAELPAEAYVPAVDRGAATEVALNVIGVLFTVAFSAFLLRVLRKRADRAANVRVVAENRARRAAPVPDTPPSATSCFVGAAMAAVIALVLLQFSGFLDDWFQQQPQSDQYAVRNVAGTLRSIITGVSYLGTGLFAANAVGLTGLGVQTLAQQAAGAPAEAAKQDAAGQEQEQAPRDEAGGE